MTDATRFLTSLAQALAKMSLYADGHPARAGAADASFAQLRALQQLDPAPRFSFLGRSVVYGDRALRELSDWDWSAKLSGAGVQRIEFPESVDPEEYRGFLEDILTSIALVAGGKVRSEAEPAHGRITPIRFGAIGVRGSAGAVEEPKEIEALPSDVDFDLTEEADVVSWMHDEVTAARRLPLAEAETVIDSLLGAMHQDGNAFVPLLMLKEFDQYTTTHAMNVAVLSMGLAERLNLSAREVRGYGIAGLLHDLGKVKIPLEILQKPGALTPEELGVMRAHPVEGARLILDSDNRLDLSAAVAFEHHIMIDGGGYPTRRSRRECHHASMLVHVCDVFDALRTHRPYRVAWESNAIVEYISQRAGTEFHPDIARVFIEMLRERDVRQAHALAIDGSPEPVATTAVRG
jgi:HD-GYP domain-containing protein (c-di-GMP phosphodiesterase class II)